MRSLVWKKVVLGAALSVGLVASPVTALPALAADIEQPGEGETALNFLAINDFHGRIDENTVSFAGTVEELKAGNPEGTTALLSAGDNVGASLFASAVQADEPTIEVLNELGLRASAVGNHEFDAGQDNLVGQVSEWADFPYLAANVYEAGTDEPILGNDGYVAFELNGMTVAVIGAVTQETPALVTPGGIAGLEFGDPVEAVNRVAEELDASGEVDVIIAAYHEGAPFGPAEGESEAAALERALSAGGAFANIVNNTSPLVDVMLTGHTHAQYAWDVPVPGEAGETRPVLQTGSYGGFVGEVQLIVDGEGDVVRYTAANEPITATPVETLIASYPAVAAVSDTVDAALAKAEEVGGQKIGEVTADITTAFSGADGAQERDDRGAQSALGNLVAQALVDTLSSERLGGAEIGVTNPGGLRAELCDSEVGVPPEDGDLCEGGADGIITYAEANAVLSFVNNLWTTTLTGAQFKTMLEQQWQPAESSRQFLALGLSDNVSYTYNPQLAEGNRILSVTINGEPLDPAAAYRIGTFSFLAQGGDNFSVFTEGTDTRDSGLIDRDAWITYLTANSPVSPDFSQRGVIVQGSPSSVAAGEDISFEVSNLNSASLGAPTVSELEVVFMDASGNSEVLAKETVSDGAATVSVTVPSGAAANASLVLNANPTDTVAVIPLAVTGAVADDGGTDGAAGGGAPDRNDGLNVDSSARGSQPGSVLAALVLALGLLTGSGMWLRRRV